jgi:hypothetical protein
MGPKRPVSRNYYGRNLLIKGTSRVGSILACKQDTRVEVIKSYKNA